MTNYEEFKAIADDIAEMYANGYAEYAEYFSETFSGIGELSAVTRMSDRLYTLRHTDVKDPQYTTALKEIAIGCFPASVKFIGVYLVVFDFVLIVENSDNHIILIHFVSITTACDVSDFFFCCEQRLNVFYKHHREENKRKPETEKGVLFL